MTHEELIAAGYKLEPADKVPAFNSLRDEWHFDKYLSTAEDQPTCLIQIYVFMDMRNPVTVIHVGNKHSLLTFTQSIAEAESFAWRIYAATQDNPAVSEFLGFADDECGNILLVDGKIVDEDDDSEAPESIEIGRSEEFNKLLAAAKAEIGVAP